MSVLENLGNLSKKGIERNLSMFKIKSVGNLKKDTVNLKNFYFENIETLYKYFPICT